MDRNFGDLERKTVDLQIELEPRNALGCASELKVHVTEVIFFTEDVGDGCPFSD